MDRTSPADRTPLEDAVYALADEITPSLDALAISVGQLTSYVRTLVSGVDTQLDTLLSDTALELRLYRQPDGSLHASVWRDMLEPGVAVQVCEANDRGRSDLSWLLRVVSLTLNSERDWLDSDEIPF